MAFQQGEFALPQTDAHALGQVAEQAVFPLVLQHIDGVALDGHTSAGTENVYAGHIAFGIVEGAVEAGVQHDDARVAADREQIGLVNVGIAVGDGILHAVHGQEGIADNGARKVENGIQGGMQEGFFLCRSLPAPVLTGRYAFEQGEILLEGPSFSGGADVLGFRSAVFGKLEEIGFFAL